MFATATTSSRILPLQAGTKKSPILSEPNVTGTPATRSSRTLAKALCDGVKIGRGRRIEIPALGQTLTPILYLSKLSTNLANLDTDTFFLILLLPRFVSIVLSHNKTHPHT